jgi:hypothetical protein
MDAELIQRLMILFGRAMEEMEREAAAIDAIFRRHLDKRTPSERRGLFEIAEQTMKDAKSDLERKAGCNVRTILFDDALVRRYRVEINEYWQHFRLYLLLKMRLGES